MKKCIILLILTFIVKISFSLCTMSGMYFFPKQKEISLNPMFIISAYAMSQETILSFKNRDVYIESNDGDIVQLILQEILVGQKQLTQAIFKPAKELKPYTTYFLKYSNQIKEESSQMSIYSKQDNERRKVFWKTKDNKQKAILNSNLSIIFKDTEVIFYGCGPSANAIFEIKDSNDDEIYYKTELINIETKNKTTYYITERNNLLSVGHGMCAGAFTFKEIGEYKVRFTPMNIDGKQSNTTDWFTFESPYSNSKFPLGN